MFNGKTFFKLVLQIQLFLPSKKISFRTPIPSHAQKGEGKKWMTKGCVNAQSDVRQGVDDTNDFYGLKSS
jgi:hypothetical protein